MQYMSHGSQFPWAAREAQLAQNTIHLTLSKWFVSRAQQLRFWLPTITCLWAVELVAMSVPSTPVDCVYVTANGSGERSRAF